jgi:LuxR family maltose regulon positive regulatory protein
MATPLLATKLCIPRVRSEFVARPYLLEKLNAGLSLKLTLVSAPAGSGKTTLLAQWVDALQREDGSPALAWLSLDAGDDDPARFLAYLTAALGEQVQGLISPPGLPQLRAGARRTEESLTLLINQLAGRGAQVVLVLDDYHLITAQAIHDATDFLLAHLPDNVHLVIATRADPPLQLSRWRGRGQLNELRQADLPLTRQQITDFMRRATGLSLSAEEADLLALRTEGWITGLQMAALALQGREDPAQDLDRFLQSFTGEHRFVLDYLVEEVLDRQPEEIQAFLLNTSVLERLSGPLCDAVVKDAGPAPISTDGQAMLERLERENLFIVSLDQQRSWYRYQRLFADLLRQRFQQRYPDQVARRHQQASHWYAEQAAATGEDWFTTQAIQHTLLGEDMERAARLIETVAEATLQRSETTTFLRWVEALPDAALQARPRLCIFAVVAQLLGGYPLQQVESALRVALQGDQPAEVAGETVALRALLATLQGDAQRSVDLSQQALSLLAHKRGILYHLVLDNLGLAYLLVGEMDAAIDALWQAAHMSRDRGDVMGAVGALANVAGLYMMQGQLQRAKEIYERALAWATDDQGRRLPVAGKVLMGLGELYREWNDYEKALDYLTSGVVLTRQYAEIGAIVGYLSLVRLRQSQGNLAAAQTCVEEARQIAQRFDASQMDDNLVAVQQARIWIEGERLEDALQWAQRRELIEVSPGQEAGRLATELRQVEYATLARLYLAQGRPEKALSLLEPPAAPPARGLWHRRFIEVLVLRALAFHAQGELAAAVSALERALDLGRPAGYVRIFLDEGPDLAPLLYRVVEKSEEPLRTYAGRLLAALDLSSTRKIPSPPGQDDAIELVEPLSPREVEVLQLVAQGLSNREIAARLFIALSTVKGHTSNIYGKLEVTNRTAAVARARTLGILPDRPV